MSAADANAGAIHLVDELFFAGERDEAWIISHGHLSDDARGVAHPLVQRELQRQREALDLLEAESFSDLFADPAPPQIVDRLRQPTR
jgi:hypothetical protein